MRNAKEEFLDHIKGTKASVRCATISRGDDYWDKVTFKATLKVGYSDEEFSSFVESLDFSYDCGYGGQEIFGTIWYFDGTWSHRGEYDGSEWWEYNKCPPIPEDLNDNS